MVFEQIQRALGERPRTVLPQEGLVPSAVLVPVFERDQQLQLLMEVRTDQVDKHKGQISFPGGVCDAGDRDPVITALREAEEEVGLSRADVRVLGLASDTTTVTGFHITPVVGAIPHPYPFRINPVEVERLLLVPWAVFVEGRGHRQEQVEHAGNLFLVDFYDFEGVVIWGATARICRALVETITGQIPGGHP
jgi:8-oxo-dGTP pyrophosphatase MutT (NUDIX family)